MNHCLDVVCTNCGASYCALCRGGEGPDEEFKKLLEDMLAMERERKIYEYKHLVCHHCGRVGLHDADDALLILNELKQ